MPGKDGSGVTDNGASELVGSKRSYDEYLDGDYSNENLEDNAVSSDVNVVVEMSEIESKFRKLLANFKNKLKGMDKIANTIWNENPILADYFSGKSSFDLSFDELIECYNDALKCRFALIIKGFWHENLLLASYFDQADLPNLIEYFNDLLPSRAYLVIELFWKKYSILGDYFSRQYKYNEKQLNLPESLAILKTIFNSRCLTVIKQMWNNDSQLADFTSGKLIEDYQLTPTELLSSFKAALSSNCLLVIEYMWNMPESPLKDIIKNITDKKELSELISKVMSNCLANSTPTMSPNEFITSFLSLISDADSLEAQMLKFNENQSSYRNIQKKIIN